MKFNLQSHAIIPGMIPQLSISTHVSQDYMNLEKVFALSIDASLIWRNTTLAVSESTPFHLSVNGSQIYGNHTFHFPMTRQTIDLIEKHRTDDVDFQVHTSPHIICYNQNYHDHRIDTSSFQFTLSQNKWCEYLEQMGYTSFWVFELARLDMEGMTEVNRLLTKAQKSLRSHAYDDSVTNSRAALKSFHTLMRVHESELKDILDADSVHEDGYDSKSKRILDLFKKIESFCHLGAHRESYTTTYMDAELAFYQTVSIISYLSRSLGRIES